MTETFEATTSCLDYMDTLYQGISGFISYQPGEKEERKKQKVFLTYGEILPSSMDVLIESLSIHSNDVFYDLGSGIGKVPLHFFLKTPVRKAVGIEASKERHHSANNVYRAIKQRFPEVFNNRCQLECIQENFLTANISDATIVYSCSTCFDETLLSEMGQVLDNCVNLKYVLTMKPIPMVFLTLLDVFEVECTWDKVECYLYRRP